MVEVVKVRVPAELPHAWLATTSEPAVVGVLDERLSMAIVLVPDGVEWQRKANKVASTGKTKKTVPVAWLTVDGFITTMEAV